MLLDTISLFVPMGIITMFILIDLFRKGSIEKTRAYYSDTFFTKLPPYRAFKTIVAFATKNGYQIDDFNELNLAIILNERMSWKSFGSFYTIYIREQAGKTFVEVGVAGKVGKLFYLISPFNKKLVTLRLERMLNAVKAAVFDYERPD
ncbi:MAG TPA: hypothetical protein VLX29_03750 [Nitrospirota bacterium]|nr:hypothetical protein [Nitrospirota bacterium]